MKEILKESGEGGKENWIKMMEQYVRGNRNVLYSIIRLIERGIMVNFP